MRNNQIISKDKKTHTLNSNPYTFQKKKKDAIYI